MKPRYNTMTSDKTTKEILKAVRKMRREEELRAYGHPVNYTRVVKSKKVYSRKAKHKSRLGTNS